MKLKGRTVSGVLLVPWGESCLLIEKNDLRFTPSEITFLSTASYIN